MKSSTINSIQIAARWTTVLPVALGIVALMLASSIAAPPVPEPSAKPQASHADVDDSWLDESEEHADQSNDDAFDFRELHEQAKRFRARFEKLNREHQGMLEQMQGGASGFDSLNPRLPPLPKMPKIPSPWKLPAPFSEHPNASPWQPPMPLGMDQIHKFSGPGSYSRSWHSSSSSSFSRSNNQFSATDGSWNRGDSRGTSDRRPAERGFGPGQRRKQTAIRRRRRCAVAISRRGRSRAGGCREATRSGLIGPIGLNDPRPQNES